jgi:hypothetical protein
LVEDVFSMPPAAASVPGNAGPVAAGYIDLGSIAIVVHVDEVIVHGIAYANPI